jgi:hypothetical protein
MRFLRQVLALGRRRWRLRDSSHRRQLDLSQSPIPAATAPNEDEEEAQAEGDRARPLDEHRIDGGAAIEAGPAEARLVAIDGRPL